MAKASLLRDIDVDRVDAVDAPAHKSRFLILKSEDAAELQVGVQKLADASEALFNAIAKRQSASVVRKAAAAVGTLIGKDVSVLTTLRDPGAGPDSDEKDAKPLPEDMKGQDNTADDGTPLVVPAEGEEAGHPSPEGDDDHKPLPEDMKGEDNTDEQGTPEKVDPEVNKAARFCAKCSSPIVKGHAVAKRLIAKGRVMKGMDCPMCGAPTDETGKFDQAATVAPAPAPVAPAPVATAPAYPGAAGAAFKAEGDKPWDDDENKDEDKKDKKPWESDEFTEKMASIVAKSVDAAITKFAASMAQPSAIAKSKQPADDRITGGRVDMRYRDLVFGPMAGPRG